MRSTALLLYLVPWAVGAQAPVWLWATGLDGNGSTNVEQIAASTTNGSFVTGNFSNSLALPSSTLINDGTLGDRFVAGVDSLGNVLWAIQHDTPIAAMGPTADGGLVCAIPYTGNMVFNGVVYDSSVAGTSALIITMDGDGTPVSVANIVALIEPAVTESALLLDIDPDAGLALLTQYTDSVAIGGQLVYTNGVALARFTIEGDLLWADRIGNASPMRGALNLDPNGNVLVLLSNSEPILASDTVFTEWGGTMASYDGDGSYEWRVQDLGYDLFDPPVIDRRADGGVFVGISQPSQGPIGGGTELILKSISGIGVEEWTSWASGSTQWGHAILSIESLPGDRALLAGYAMSSLPMGGLAMSLPGEPNGFVGIVSSGGEWEWSASETAGNVMGFRAVHGSTSRIYTAGRAITSATFGSAVIPLVGADLNGFVACLGDITLGIDAPILPTHRLIGPNPAHDHLVVHARPGEDLRILDAQGRIVKRSGAATGTVRIDIASIPTGLYIMLIGTDAEAFVKE